MGSVPELPRYLVWRPSKSDPKQIRMKLPLPDGGHLVQWISVSHNANSVNEAASAAIDLLNDRGRQFWPNWPDTSIKPKIRRQATSPYPRRAVTER